jgi:hypothetical protein
MFLAGKTRNSWKQKQEKPLHDRGFVEICGLHGNPLGNIRGIMDNGLFLQRCWYIMKQKIR